MQKRFFTLLTALFVLVFGPTLAFAGHGGPHALAGYRVGAIAHSESAPLVRNQDAIITMVTYLLATENMAPDVAAKLAALSRQSQYEYEVANSLPIPLEASLKYDWLPTHYAVHAAAAFNNEMLVTLRDNIPGYQSATSQSTVRDFYNAVNDQMSGMLIPCNYSGLTFSTAEFITLDWGSFRNINAIRSMPESAPKLALTAFIGLLALGFLARNRKRYA